MVLGQDEQVPMVTLKNKRSKNSYGRRSFKRAIFNEGQALILRLIYKVQLDNRTMKKCTFKNSGHPNIYTKIKLAMILYIYYGAIFYYILCKSLLSKSN